MSDGAWQDYPDARPGLPPRVLAHLVGWAVACGAIEVVAVVAIVRWWQG